MLALASLHQVRKRKVKGELHLTIVSKGLWSITIAGDDGTIDPIYDCLMTTAWPADPLDLFAFNPSWIAANLPLREHGWSLYDPVKEFKRIGIPNKDWKVSKLNRKWALSETYPRILVVPKKASNELVTAAASFRSRGRLPVCVWQHPVSYSTSPEEN